MEASIKDIIGSLSHEYANISFDGFSDKQIKKINTIYQIPQGERIIASVHHFTPLQAFAADGIIVTDQALYIPHRRRDQSAQNRFPLSELCEYVAFQDGKRASVFLGSIRGRVPIYKGKLLAKNKESEEITAFIRDIQNALTAQFPLIRDRRTQAVSDLICTYRAEMRKGRLSEESQPILHSLLYDSFCGDPAAKLLGEDAFRSCSTKEYEEFIGSLPVSISSSAKDFLFSAPSVFSDNLINDLSDASLTMDQAYLQSAQRCLIDLVELNEKQCFILAYLCIRLGKHEAFETIRQQILRRFGNARLTPVLVFRGQFYNQRMRAVLERIMQGESLDDDCLAYTDSMGLNVLHYALLLRKEEYVFQLLNRQKWRINTPVPGDDTAAGLYDYNVLACLTGFSDRELILRKTSDLIMAQERSQKALKRKLWLCERRINVQRTSLQVLKRNLAQAKQNRATLEQQDAIHARIEEICQLRMDTEQEIAELRDSIYEIELEIQNLLEYGLLESMDTAQKLRDSRDPFVLFILQIISDPQRLNHILSVDKDSCRLYYYRNTCFVTPADIIINLPFEDFGSHHENAKHDGASSKRQQSTTDSKRREATNDPIIRPYGESWFSPRAHRDMKVLKEEYRKLAKQYHPDLCSHIKSKEIFQEILNERASILESMSTA